MTVLYTYGENPVFFRVSDKTSMIFKKSSLWNKKRFSSDMILPVPDKRYSNISYLWRKVAEKDISGNWLSLIPCDSILPWDASLAHLVMENLSRVPDAYVSGSCLFLGYKNQKASSYRDTCGDEVFTDDENYVELEISVKDAISLRNSVPHKFSVGMKTSAQSKEELLSILYSKEFWNNRENLEALFLSPLMLHGASIELLYERELVAIDVFAQEVSPVGKDGSVNYSLHSLHFPLKDDTDVLSFRKSISEIRIIGGGNDNDFSLPDF